MEAGLTHGATGAHELEDSGWPVLEHFFQGLSPVLDQGVKELDGGQHLAGGLDLGEIGARFLEQLGGVFGLEAAFFECFLVLEPVLVAAVLPVGEVLDIEAFAGFAQFVDDDVIGQAVVEHAVDEVAGGFGQAGDFAATSLGIYDLRITIYEDFDEG